MKFPSAMKFLCARRFKEKAEPLVLPAQLFEIRPKRTCLPKAQVALRKLLAELELLGNRLVAVYVGSLQIIEQTPPLANHHEQSPAGAMILLIFLKVIGEMVDALRQQRNLDIRRAGIPLVELKITNRLRFCLHVFLLIRAISH
jgi:hypothetical protein